MRLKTSCLICVIILSLTLFSCGNEKSKGLSNESKLESIRLFNEKFELELPSAMMPLNQPALKIYDKKNPPQAGFVNNDSSVVITIRNLPVKAEHEKVRFNAIVKTLSDVTTRAGTNKIIDEVRTYNGYSIYVLDLTGNIEDKLLKDNGKEIASFIFVLVERGEYFLLEMHYPADNSQNTDKLKEKILNSFKILKEELS